MIFHLFDLNMKFVLCLFLIALVVSRFYVEDVLEIIGERIVVIVIA